MFQKILIANRGEIACRIIKTAQRMGISTVAVYSDADRDALHVEMADEAVRIGPPPALESYLNTHAILDAAKRTKAEAVHPGYGFLSERQSFAEAVTKVAGLVFIGPCPEAIAALGDKIYSKKLAKAADVSILPGNLGEVVDLDHARRIVAEIGYPVIVKSSAGGGGKGLRVVRSDKDLEQALCSSHNEARTSFGDDRLFIEKFVTGTRHIEIQIIGDKHGNVVHLGERECSIQRRHQKVIEEAPSVFVDAPMREEMGAQAVALAKAAGYDSAGTVEFAVDKERNFYFLEMNARLQVEHTVTELATGLDIVELMIRSSAGEKLPLDQHAVRTKGWALETRVYAEDPARGFLPSSGRLSRYSMPAEGKRGDATVRIDTGVHEGDEVSVFYDPMIAKVCTYAPTRIEAIDTMARVLDEVVVGGIRQNLSFLNAVMHSQRFRAGKLSTAFINEEFPHGFRGRPLDVASKRRFVAAAVAAKLARTKRASGISGTLNGPHRASAGFVAVVGGEEFGVTDAYLREGVLFACIENENYAAETDWRPGRPILFLREREAEYAIQIVRLAGAYALSQGGIEALVTVRTPRAAELARFMSKKTRLDTSKLLHCPMPGLVVSVRVEPGQEVKTGEPLAVVEAMKMENVLVAERDGTIGQVNVRTGDNLALNDVILEFA
ncbi:MAG: acetyl/propionyl/methylcrotonyl-CoA carboxylase subunit alpha [Alphaproteobacteria bacterium]|nr:acetyl/propionyl/methylcrotonyl-CoA carboxylase subunit alpha [Alphaproteobacteria bacterium]